MSQIIERHEKTLLAIQGRCKDIVPPDQKVLLVVYDGPNILTRQASWIAPGATDKEAATIMTQISETVLNGKAIF